MTERLTLQLWEPEQAKKALAHTYACAKPKLLDGKRMVVKLEPETRKIRQNNHYHCLIDQISEQIGGDLASKEDAKRILISAFRIDTINEEEFKQEWAKFGVIRMGRGLRGEVVLMGNQSREFSVKLAQAFIHWLYAFGADHELTFKAWGEEEASA